MDCPSRNQELAENSVDQVHFRYVHGTKTVASTKAGWSGPCFHVISKPKVGTPQGEADGTIRIDTSGFGYGVTRFREVVETLVTTAGTPIDEQRVHMRLSLALRKLDDVGATSGIGKAFVEEIERRFSQDIPICENKTQRERPILCDGVGPIAELRRWAHQFYMVGPPDGEATEHRPRLAQ